MLFTRIAFQRTVLFTALPRRLVALRSGLRGVATNVNTVDASEIELFSRLSSQWWNERGEFAMLHKMNPVRMEFIKQKLQEIQMGEGTLTCLGTTPLEGLNVLDVGCGGGLLSEVRNPFPTSLGRIPSIFLLDSCETGSQDYGNRRFRSKYWDSFDSCCRRSTVCSINQRLDVPAYDRRSVAGRGKTVRRCVFYGGLRAR